MTMETKTAAPEIKAVPETMTAAFDDFMIAFEAFKDVNDRRLDEIEQKLTADVVTRDKVERINKAIDDQSKLIDQLALKKLRPPLGRSGGSRIEASEHKAAFEAYIRRGEEGALRELEAKAMASGLRLAGVDIGADIQGDLADAAVSLAGSLGGMLAIYGRFSAKAAIARR